MTVKDTGDVYDPMSALLFDGGGVHRTVEDTGDVYQLTAEELKEKERVRAEKNETVAEHVQRARARGAGEKDRARTDGRSGANFCRRVSPAASVSASRPVGQIPRLDGRWQWRVDSTCLVCRQRVQLVWRVRASDARAC